MSVERLEVCVGRHHRPGCPHSQPRMAEKPSRRAAWEKPHSAEHDASMVGRSMRGVEPRTLAGYLRWMALLWDEERPTEMHGSGPFFGPPGRGLSATHSTESQLVGGSLLGAPRYSDPFRRLLENSPWETEQAEYDGHVSTDRHYVRPLHAALASLAHSHPMTARTLTAIAYAGFDWEAVATRLHWDTEMFSLFLEKAFHVLWNRFELAPRANRMNG